MSTLPKYCRYPAKRSKTLTYARQLPEDVASITGKGRWSRGLRVSPKTHTAVEVARAVEKAEELFHLYIKQARNSDAEAFSDREVDTLAAEIMRKEGLRAGMFANDTSVWGDPAADASGGVSDAELSNPPTLEERARQTIYWALKDAKDAPRAKRLSDLVREYTTAEGKTGKALVDVERPWHKAMAHIGDRFITDDTTPEYIHAGLDNWMSERLESVVPASVRRELNSVMAVLRWANKRYRLMWTLQPPDLPKGHKQKTKQPLTREEQRALVEDCVTRADPKAAVLLAMLQGGLMPTEVQRLDIEATRASLASANPHLLIGYDGADTKTEARKRIVPIVVAVDVVRAHLPAGIEWAASRADPSATLNKRLRKLCPGKTGHCLRHSLSANIHASRVPHQHGARIAGWSAGMGIPEHLMHYGAEGVAEAIGPLTESSRLIHAHLLP